MKPFQLHGWPPLRLGPGVRRTIATTVARWGKRCALVTGGSHLQASPHWDELQADFIAAGVIFHPISVSQEPSPDQIDTACSAMRAFEAQTVVAIGGGSVLDAGKAIAAMLPQKVDSVRTYLEGLPGSIPFPGTHLPWIAVPTTSGTGSEMTHNAVLTQLGVTGFKRSLRHPNLIACEVFLDPELMLGCPPGISAACGMDTLTQLLEPYLSPRCSPPLTALIEDALTKVGKSLPKVCDPRTDSLADRSHMAYASAISGVALSNAGLGIVHGIASPLGALLPIPHGVICGRTVAAATSVNTKALAQESPETSKGVLHRLARAAFCLTGQPCANIHEGANHLGQYLKLLTHTLPIPPLPSFGFAAPDWTTIAAKTSNRDNPVQLSHHQICTILEESW
ncbi:MAG: iron-containing alcohol dehydrogenase [Okeania sp. SIO1H5]|uniref:iron-containing alcohol dehydrogenase n=1 Tax=Okeania sp. SIO1H5 TaxID=2607777 RepID=UPI0013B5DF06|nr:iron-containing alcohol dehydrogenase [Okeania sp. SIO1H5]